MKINLVRRAVVRGIGVGLLLLVAPALRAQDPRAISAQKVARAWLAIADRGDAEASWKASGGKFQNTLTLDEWTLAMRDVRVPLGEVKERTMLQTEFDNSFPGAPEGVYAHIEFRTTFGKKTGGETVSLEYQSDGEWHVIGYSIH